MGFNHHQEEQIFRKNLNKWKEDFRSKASVPNTKYKVNATKKKKKW